jgi:hypothetical protein
MPSDATPAYRGYRLQALYALSRILSPSTDEVPIFQPEGQEDLAVLHPDGILSEVNQVKAYSSDLVVSNFSPDKPDSFFYRVHDLLSVLPSLKIYIISFGAVGPELGDALGGNTQIRHRVALKLADYGYMTENEAENLLSKIQVRRVEEEEITQQVYAAMRDSLVGIEPERAFELLNNWLYVCSERKCQITHGDVISRLNDIGRFANERAAHHREWFTSIVPVQDHDLDEGQLEELSGSFYRGVSAKYEHILAGLDIPRPVKLEEIASKFRKARVVIAHGASGQGKTTLAYRYLHDYFPEMWRFQVRHIENRQHALSIVAALVGQASAIDVPMAVYLDVAPKDNEWPELVRHLSTHGNIHILVTVREEDFQRATISGAEFEFEPVELVFDHIEAERLYLSLTQKEVPSRFLSFDDAWRTFMAGGPLLEFVYLVTQGALLRERLAEQITRLRDMVRDGTLQANELVLLQLASIASALEARLNIRPLAEHLGLADPIRTLQLFEGEYLLRRSEDGITIEGLHPIRSGLLSELLSDPVFSPWSESASTCLPFIHARDVEAFLLYSFSRHQSELEPLLHALESYNPTDWIATAGVIRSLLWLGILEYVKINRQLIDDAIESRGSGWSLLLDFDITDAVPGSAQNILELLCQMRPEQSLEFQTFRSRQTDKDIVFARARAWLSNQNQLLSSPSTETDWQAVGEVLFWVGHWGMSSPLVEQVTEELLDEAIISLPLGTLGDLMLGLERGYGSTFSSWLERNRAELLMRFREDTLTLGVQDDGKKLTAHFIIDGRKGQGAGTKPLYSPVARSKSDDLHNEAVQRISLLSRLVPDRELYGSQGYGHRPWSPELVAQLRDSTNKPGILKTAFPPQWLTGVNATFQGMAVQPLRPDTWEDYAQRVIVLRKHVVATLKHLQQALEVYFRKRTMFGEQFLSEGGQGLLPLNEWKECRHDLNLPILLPRCAVDEWGIVTETSSFAENLDEMTGAVAAGAMAARKGLLIKEYQTFLEALTKYDNALGTFMFQAVDVMELNPVLGKGLSTPANRGKVLQQAEQKGIHSNASALSMINLNETVMEVHNLQREFRHLLGRFCNEAELGVLDKQEAALFSNVWSLWYFLAFQPSRVVPSATQVFTGQTADTLKAMRKGVERKLKDLSVEVQGVTFSVVNKTILWNGEPTLCIMIDGPDALAVYKARDSVLAAVRQAQPLPEGNELRRYVQDLQWHYVTVIPLVRGRLLATTAWHIFLRVLQSEESATALKWWNYDLKQIPADTQKQLGLSLWEASQLEVASALDTHTAELYLMVGHLRDLLSLPELDEAGSKQVQSYIEAISEQISQGLQAVFDDIERFARALNVVKSEEPEKYPNLGLLGDGLQELYDAVLPNPDYVSDAPISMHELPDWATRLENVRDYAVGLYLVWATDVLAQLNNLAR